MRTVFFGSTAFALPTLAEIARAHTLALVVAHPDSRVGRGRKPAAPVAKTFAAEHGIRCIQPKRIREPDVFEAIAQARPEFIVVADYGKKIPDNLLALPSFATVNLHPSLLPRHRGPAPIPYTILSGDTVAGNSVIGLTDEIDAGPVYAQQQTDLLPHDTTDSLSARLAESGADLMVQTLRRIAEEGLQPKPQDHEQATYAPMLKKEDGLLDFSDGVANLERKVRAMQPWPVARWSVPVEGQPGGMQINVLRATCEEGAAPEEPGTVVAADKAGIRIAAVDGILTILELQPAGRKRMSAADFVNGYRIILHATEE